MRIGLLNVEDPTDVRTYSGTPFHLLHFLREAGHEVRPLGPYPLRHRIWVRAQNRLLMFAQRQLIWERHRLIAAQYPKIVERYADENPDLDLLLGTSAFYIAGAKANLPIVFWGDTTVAGVINGYTRYKNLSQRTIKQCHLVEQNALTACDLAIYSNQWAADLALRTYKLDSAKVRVITYGANLFDTPSSEDVKTFLANRSEQHIKCIIIGWDWERKGVQKAIEIVGELRRRGLEATLQIVGCFPPKGGSVPSYVSLVGTIPKFTAEGRQKLAQLISASHLLILPTLAECAAVVLSEANAFGVPVLTSDVGGNSSIVTQNANGILVAPDESVLSWANAAMQIVGDRSNYERFATESHRIFRQELSWNSAIVKFEEATDHLHKRAKSGNSNLSSQVLAR